MEREAPRLIEAKAASSLERFAFKAGISLERWRALHVDTVMLWRKVGLHRRKSTLKSPRIREGWYSDWKDTAKSEWDREGGK